MNNCIYKEQQKFLDEVAEKLGIVCFRPSYHGKGRDANTVLFYTMEDEVFNRNLNEKHGAYLDSSLFKPYIWYFENTDANGFTDCRFANRGSIDLRRKEWEMAIENFLRISIYLKQRGESSLCRFTEIAHCKDCIKFIEANLNVRELELVENSIKVYFKEISDEKIRMRTACWIEGLLHTDDFVEEIKSNRK